MLIFIIKMINMKIYKVETCFGSWYESKYQRNGFFSTREKAETVKQIIINKIKHIRDLKNKIDLDYLLKEDLNKYNFYSDMFNIETDYIGTKIEKIELDEMDLFELTNIGTREEKINRLLGNG